MDELLLLKQLSDEQKEIKEQIDGTDKKFKLLVMAIESGKMEKFLSASDVSQTFGAPIFTEEVFQGEEKFVRWFYRYATEYFGSEKVYLYFDQADKLIKWEHVPSRH